MRRTNRNAGSSPNRTHSYAFAREIPNNAAASVTVTVNRPGDPAEPSTVVSRSLLDLSPMSGIRPRPLTRPHERHPATDAPEPLTHDQTVSTHDCGRHFARDEEIPAGAAAPAGLNSRAVARTYGRRRRVLRTPRRPGVPSGSRQPPTGAWRGRTPPGLWERFYPVAGARRHRRSRKSRASAPDRFPRESHRSHPTLPQDFRPSLANPSASRGACTATAGRRMLAGTGRRERGDGWGHTLAWLCRASSDNVIHTRDMRLQGWSEPVSTQAPDYAGTAVSLSAHTKAGTTVCQSPTMPTSAASNTGASGSGLTASTKPAPRTPTMWLNFPEMPSAT